MKLDARGIPQALAAPAPAFRVYLVYGPDAGLVKERAAIAIAAVAGEVNDPFRVEEVPAVALRDEPGRLYDAAASLSMTGGRRAVRLRSADDAATASVEAVLELDAADSLVVVEAGELGPQSKLRRLCETHAHALAVPCYADDARSLGELIRATLGAHGLEIDRDAFAYLSEALGADRLVSRSELEKLALYMGGPGEVSLDDARACIGDSAALAADDIAFSALGGESDGLARALDRAALEGVAPVAILRSVARHARRLQQVAAQVEGGTPLDTAMGALRPAVFFRVRDRFARQARRWSAARLGDALALLNEAEIQCKTTGLPADAICGRALMRLVARGQPSPRQP